jgi:hypothetical protein
MMPPCNPERRSAMKYRYLRPPAAVGLVMLLALALASGGALAQDEIKKPEPGVPEIFTLQGQFVRIAYNNEGYASLGYRLANQSAGEEWMLLEMGVTVRHGVKNYTLKREHLSLETPDGKTIPLPTNAEYRKAQLRSLENRAKVVRDSINYFPPMATQACPIRFFVELGGPGSLPLDQIELSDRRACLGRLFFKVPGGIQYGQHWLNVQYEKSLVRVPFRILTKEEEKEFSKKWKDIKKEHEKAFKQ